jgi:hypothetical protein
MQRDTCLLFNRETWVLSKLLGTLNQWIVFVIICVEDEFLEHGWMIVSFRGFEVYDEIIMSKFVVIQSTNWSKLIHIIEILDVLNFSDLIAKFSTVSMWVHSAVQKF